MIEAAARGLAAESLPRRFVVRQFGIEHLERHIALQARIERFEHNAHAAAANHSHHVEMRQAAEISRVVGRLQKIRGAVLVRVGLGGAIVGA